MQISIQENPLFLRILELIAEKFMTKIDIYISEYPKGCIVGYLTNRDDKPEVVQEWIILSGKENCKITESFVLIQ